MVGLVSLHDITMLAQHPSARTFVSRNRDDRTYIRGKNEKMQELDRPNHGTTQSVHRVETQHFRHCSRDLGIALYSSHHLPCVLCLEHPRSR